MKILTARIFISNHLVLNGYTIRQIKKLKQPYTKMLVNTLVQNTLYDILSMCINSSYTKMIEKFTAFY